jgi:catechol 2,3-dioxygenase-like lactoylglutathione lyase family enzyme
MAIQRMEHVGVVVTDLPAAKAFFAALGLELESEGPVQGRWVDRIVGLDGVLADIAIMRTADAHGRLELTKFHSPSRDGSELDLPANAPGIRHVSFAVEDIDRTLERLGPERVELVGEIMQYEDSYRLCYLRGPAGIIVELAQKLGS